MTIINFSSADVGEPLSLNCTNNTRDRWIFYIYQKLRNQQPDEFSLAWMVSPHTVAPGARVRFEWTTDDSFVWGHTGRLQPGVVFFSGQITPAKPGEQTTFSLKQNAPVFSDPTPGGQPNDLTVQVGSDVPNETFSVGIGLSNHPTVVSQARPNSPAPFVPDTKTYWISFSRNIQAGEVLIPSTIASSSAEIAFHPGIHTMSATLESDGRWEIGQG